jgi:hypothetical protein
MFRILRAFGWLRWRVLLNSLERHGGRDALERFSVASEQLLPIVVALVMIPSAISLAGASAYAGWSLARGAEPTILVQVLRMILLAACIFAVVGPVLLPAADRTNAVRLLLLPIPRGVLYVAQMISAAADPWMLLVSAALLAMPMGFAAGGAGGSAALTGAAGLLLAAALAGLALLVTNVVHLAVRDRRRGEIVTLIVLLVIPFLGVLPGVFDNGGRRGTDSGATSARSREAPEWWTAFERRALAIIPSERYVDAVRGTADEQSGGTIPPLAALAATALIVHGLAFLAFTRVLGSPFTTGSSRVAGRLLAGRRVPWVSPGGSAVALNQLKLALRTPRGRATILSPFMLFGVLALVSMRSDAGVRVSFFPLGDGLAVAAFACFVALIAIVPLAMNQFAVDRAGLTLVLLSPLDTRTLLAGKAIGNALIAAIPAAGCLVAAMLLFRDGHPALWLCIPLTLIATYLVVAPVAATLSAVFPRAVDMNSVGQGSNAHGGAGLLGTLAFLAAGAPCLLLVLLATRLVGRPGLAPLFLLVWTAVCAGAGALLFRVAAAVFDRRREALGMVAR